VLNYGQKKDPALSMKVVKIEKKGSPKTSRYICQAAKSEQKKIAFRLSTGAMN
jgi:hypothetical protein